MDGGYSGSSDWGADKQDRSLGRFVKQEKQRNEIEEETKFYEGLTKNKLILKKKEIIFDDACFFGKERSKSDKKNIKQNSLESISLLRENSREDGSLVLSNQGHTESLNNGTSSIALDSCKENSTNGTSSIVLDSSKELLNIACTNARSISGTEDQLTYYLI